MIHDYWDGVKSSEGMKVGKLVELIKQIYLNVNHITPNIHNINLQNLYSKIQMKSWIII